jgi:hypothetical protein
MCFRCWLIILSLSSFAPLADDKTYFLDRQNGDMLKYRDDQATLDLSIKAKHTDNHLYENDADKQSTDYLEISPSIKAQYHNDKHFLQLGLWLKNRKFNDFSEDDTTDRYGLLKYHHKFLSKQSVVLTGAFFNQYLDRGTSLSKGIGSRLLERDNRKSNFINIAHQLGNENSNATFTSLIGFRNTEYKNRPEVTDGLNLSAVYSIFDFQYLLSGKSYFTAKLSLEDIKHDLPLQQDRLVSTALVGIKWHKTEFTHFDLSLGTLKIEFDDGSLANKQDFKWDFKFKWSPIEAIELTAISVRAVDENRQIENSYLISDKLGLNFSYQMNDNIEIYLQNSMDILDYYFETGNETEQGFTSDMTVIYKFRSNMSLSLSYFYQRLSSFNITNEYQKNTISAGISFVL